MTAAPQRSFTECDRLLCAPGSIFEMENVVVDGRKVRVWKRAHKTFRDFLKERFTHWGDKRVFVNQPVPGGAYDDREEHSFGSMYGRALELAAWMREQGVGVGSRVAIGGQNSAGWLSCFVGAHLIGAVPVLLNSTLTPEVQVHCLTLTMPVLVLVDDADALVLGPIAAQLKGKGVGPIYTWNEVPREVQASVKSLASLKGSKQGIAEVEAGRGLDKLHTDSDGIILFTSGTTSLPKGVLITQRQAIQHVITSSIVPARAAMRAGAPAAMACAAHDPPPVQGVLLFPVPLFHVTGCLASLLRAIHAGSKIVFMRRWSVPDAVKLMVSLKITAMGGVPAIATAILQSGLLPEGHTLDAVSYGGAPPPKRLVADVRTRWPNAFPVHGFGMTETAGVQVALGGQDYIDRPEAVGLAMPISGMKIVDPKTRKEVPAGQMGVLMAHGGNIMKEYVNNPKATREALDADGWFDTGDVGYISEEGLLYLRDRAKDMIIRGGENIASAEVENAVTQDSRIAEVAAVPVPDPVLGERVGVCVTLAPGVSATPESIKAAADKRLRYPARPAIVVILDEELPRNANGKILKNDVREIVCARWKAQGGAKAEDKAKARL